MDSIFKEASSKLQGVFSSNRAGVSGSAPGGAFHMGVVTNVQINFSQQISRIYDLNKDNFQDDKSAMYYVGGRSEGRATFGRLIGPEKGSSGCDFYKDYGDICAIGEKTLTLEFTGSGKLDCLGQSSNYTLSAPILISVGITQNAQDTMVNENAQFMFADMECSQGAAAGAAPVVP